MPIEPRTPARPLAPACPSTPEAPADVAVLGLGYVGLPTAALLAAARLSVVGIDIDPAIVAAVNRGCSHVVEPGLGDLIADGVAAGRLTASLHIRAARCFVIAVPTPILPDRSPDLSHVLAAATIVAGALMPGDLVLLESTSPIGTTERVRDLFASLRPDLDLPYADGAAASVAIAYCPERVLPGRALAEMRDNDRVVGGITRGCTARAIALYARFVRGRCIATTARTAEMVKLTENAFRDVNIAFANELSMIAETMEIDAAAVIALANRHPRVDILQPGPGVGGHCIAVDPWFLAAADPARSPLIRAARGVNLAKTRHVADRAIALAAAHPEARIACFGLAFKPDIDDLRESPALAIAQALADRFGPRVAIVEPHVARLPDRLAAAGATLIDAARAVAHCGVLIGLVPHRAFAGVIAHRRDDAQWLDIGGLERAPIAAAGGGGYSAGIPQQADHVPKVSQRASFA